MPLPAAVSDINAFTELELVPRATEVIFKDSPLFRRLYTSKNFKFDGGTVLQFPLTYAKLNGGAFVRGASFNTAYVQTTTALQVAPKFYEVNITLYGTDDVINRGRNAAFSQVELLMSNASQSMAEYMMRDIYADGQSSADSGPLTTNTHMDGLLAWIDDGNASSGGYTTATDVTKSFTAVGGLTRADLFTTAPSWGAATSTVAGAIGGINSYVDRAFSTFSLNEVNKAYGKAWYGNKMVSLIVVDQAGWNKFWNSIQPNQRYLDGESDLGKIGFQSFRFNSGSVVVDQYLPAQVMLGLNMDNLELQFSSSKKWQFGFTGFKEASNSVDLAGQFLFAGNLAHTNPRLCFKMTGSGLA